MEEVDIILTNGFVVTVDEQSRVFMNGAVAVKGDAIVAVGEAVEIGQRYHAAQVVDCAGHVIMPGLINCHTHLPMTLLRGLADDLRLDVWLYGYMLPAEQKFVSPEFVRLGAQLAVAEAIRSGVTCVNDMYYFEDTIAQTLADVGIRALCSQSLMNFPTPDSASPDESLEFTDKFIAKWKNHPLIVPVIAPHAPYTCSPQLMRRCTEIALKHDVPLHIHIAETKQELDDSRAQHGMSVVHWIKKCGVLEAKVITAHCVWIDQSEMRVLKNAGASISHNPAANLKLASGIAGTQDMLDIGVTVGIGTDGPASNNDLDHFEEMRLVALLAKGNTRNPLAIPAKTALMMATIGGARACHIGHLTGSLEVGKRADLIVVNLDTLHNTPAFYQRDANAIYTQLVYAGKAADVRDTMVNGKFLMRDRALLTLNETQVKAESNAMARRISDFLAEREGDVLRKLAAISGVQQEKSFEVQVKAHVNDIQPIIDIINFDKDINVVRHVHYKQYDTYFYFAEEKSRLRYREDVRVDDNNHLGASRYRLTLVGGQTEREFPHSILLSRVRFMAPADRSLRFYREYFKPAREAQVEKERLRWEIIFDDDELFINLDRVLSPARDGYFVELKSRTWSVRDAERKAAVIGKLLARFGISDDAVLRQEYVDLVG
ncbi:MAG: amidohydrolase family protein [Anaerolineae bacterium]|nr:amidohydrolase family protein [Anaerolineae bacterium]